MNRYKNYGIALLTGALLLAGFAGNALALGTAACTDITNKATLTYAVGGVSQTGIESSPTGNSTSGVGNGTNTSFKVATKVDLTVATVNSPKSATGVDQVLTYIITNTGNDTQRYGLQLYTGAGETFGGETDDFDMGNVEVYTDDDSDYSNGGTTLIATNPANGVTMATLTANVTANGVLYVHIVADVPGGQAQGDDAMYTLKAKTYQITGRNGANGSDGTETGNSSTAGDLTTNGCAPSSTGVALADGASTGGVGTGIGDSANDGDAYATGYYIVDSASISVTKTAVTLWDPVNGDSTGDDPIAIPGAYVRYAITVTNGGPASATLTTITDALAASLAIDPNLFTGGDLTPADGPYQNGATAGLGFMVTHSGARTLASPLYYTTTSTADGVDHAGGNPGGTVTATYATILPAQGVVYTAGELKSGESVTLTFNVIIQ